MIDIDTISIKNYINELNRTISNYNELCLNLFKTLDDSKMFWQDTNAKTFYDKLYDEKVKTEKLINTLEEKVKIYEYIYHSYSVLGKKIKCNLESKDMIINKINNCIEKTNKLINIFNSIDTETRYKKKNEIMEQKNKIVNVKNNYKNIKNSIKEFYETIEKIEQDVKEKMEKIDILKIHDFEVETML